MEFGGYNLGKTDKKQPLFLWNSGCWKRKLCLFTVLDQGNHSGDYGHQLSQQRGGTQDDILGTENRGITQYQIPGLLLVLLEYCQHIKDTANDGEQIQCAIETDGSHSYIQ